jgi:hypothetical protein
MRKLKGYSRVISSWTIYRRNKLPLMAFKNNKTNNMLRTNTFQMMKKID